MAVWLPTMANEQSISLRCLCPLLTGKGQQLTYWLIGESAENRKIRLGRNLAGKYFQSQVRSNLGNVVHTNF